MDYFEEIENLEKEYEKLAEKYVKLFIQKEEMEGEDKDLDFKLENQKKNNDLVYSKLSNLRKSVVSASILNFEMMGRAFANLLTIFEREQFEFYCEEINVFKGNQEEYETLYFIAPSILNKNSLTYDFLINSKEIIILNNFYGHEEKRFLDFHINRKVYDDTDYKKFGYLADFIKYVVNYRLNNNIDINLHNIQEIIEEFVNLRKKDINSKKLIKDQC